MSENTTSSAPAHPQKKDLPPLLGALRELLLAHRDAFNQERTFLRMQALFFAQLFCFARRTVTQALLALGLTEGDWSAFYRLFGVAGRMDHEELSRTFFKQTLPHVPPSDPYVAVVDGVQLPRHSNKMPGTSWRRSPRTPPFMVGIHRAQRFMHLACLLGAGEQEQEGYSRALPLRFEPAFTEKAVPAEGSTPKRRSGRRLFGRSDGSGIALTLAGATCSGFWW